MGIFHGLNFLRRRNRSDDHNFMYLFGFFGWSRAYPHKSKQCRKQFWLSNIQLPRFIGAISVIWPRKFECKMSSFPQIISISFTNQTKNLSEVRAEMLSARNAILLTQIILKSIFQAQRWIFPNLRAFPLGAPKSIGNRLHLLLYRICSDVSHSPEWNTTKQQKNLFYSVRPRSQNVDSAHDKV